MIRLKNAYDPPAPDDGFRVLVERFWPRDLEERHAKLDLWLQEVAPDASLHVRFGEDPSAEKWEEFQRLYRDELDNKHKSIAMLRKKSAEGVLTLVHRAHNPDRSSAAVLKQYLEASGV
jgi:uncharacterized protein YeaO (DUF488 family)